MRKVILCVGGIASGKSTWAKAEVTKDPNFIRINRDDLRNMLTNYNHSQENESLVTSVCSFLVRKGLQEGRDIISDNTNLDRRQFDDMVKLVRGLNLDCMVMEKSFYCELDEAIARDAQRIGTAKVGEAVVRKFWKKQGGTQHKFYKPRVEVITVAQQVAEAQENIKKPDLDLPSAVICDLDGTLSLFNYRKNGVTQLRHPDAHFRSPYDASHADQDTVNEQVATVVELLRKAGHQIIFCSGRENAYREPTVKFLTKHLSFSDYQLHMRETGDSRKDSTVKTEMYQQLIEPKYRVWLVIDDRSQVIDAWRQLGLVAWQVAPGNF